LLLSNLNYKSLRDAVSDILGPTAGFICGWTYWFCWIVTGMADVVAITGYTQYWWPDIALWIPGALTILLLLGLNLVAVRLFGELEFWFAIIKLVAITALILVGAVMVISRFQSPDGDIAAVSILSTMAASSRTESRASLPDSRLLSSPSSAWSSPVPLPQKPKTQKRIFLARLTRFLFVSSCSTSWPL